MNDKGLTCKYCRSQHVIKYGRHKETQYYFCRDCQHKFANPRAIPKMQYPTSKIAEVLHRYYEGASLNDIRRSFIAQYQNNISDVTVWNWVNRFSKLAVGLAGDCKPSVGNVWVAYETELRITGKSIWLWDVVDTKTLFLIASYLSSTRTTRDAEQLLQQAFARTGKIPTIIYTEKLGTHLRGAKFAPVRSSVKSSTFDVAHDASIIERFHWAIEDRAKVIRGLHSLKSARLLVDGWLVHYNFFMPRTSLRGRTPASVAGIKFPLHNWKEVCEQPFEVTARIPIR